MSDHDFRPDSQAGLLANPVNALCVCGLPQFRECHFQGDLTETTRAYHQARVDYQHRMDSDGKQKLERWPSANERWARGLSTGVRVRVIENHISPMFCDRVGAVVRNVPIRKYAVIALEAGPGVHMAEWVGLLDWHMLAPIKVTIPDFSSPEEADAWMRVHGPDLGVAPLLLFESQEEADAWLDHPTRDRYADVREILRAQGITISREEWDRSVHSA